MIIFFVTFFIVKFLKLNLKCFLITFEFKLFWKTFAAHNLRDWSLLKSVSLSASVSSANNHFKVVYKSVCFKRTFWFRVKLSLSSKVNKGIFLKCFRLTTVSWIQTKNKERSFEQKLETASLHKTVCNAVENPSFHPASFLHTGSN